MTEGQSTVPQLHTSPWSSPASRFRKRPAVSASSPIKIPQRDRISESFDAASSFSPPKFSDSPSIGKRGRSFLQHQATTDSSIGGLSPPPVRSSMSKISSVLSVNARRRTDSLCSSGGSSVDSFDLAKIGKILLSRGAPSKNEKTDRAKVVLNREISVRPGSRRHESVDRPQIPFRDMKYIEPIGSAQPHAAFTALRIEKPEVARAVESVLDAYLHYGPEGQSVRRHVRSQRRRRPSSAEKFDMLTPDQLIRVADATTALLRTSPTLECVQAPVKVFGDLHGQFVDLLEFFRRYGAPSHRHGDINICNYIFAGDLVDRGAFSLEVLSLILCLKLRYHPRVVILRGNHEDAALNRAYGFENECTTRLGAEAGKRVLDAVWCMFEMLPLAALIDDRVVCMHGGIGKHVKRLSQIRSIKRPLRLVPVHIHENPVVVDLLWSDPTDTYGRDVSVRQERPHARSSPNAKRGVGSVFDAEDVERFCVRNDVDLIVRAHECVDPGWTVTAGGRCITVFSAPRYCGTHRNAGAILEINRQLEVQCKKILSDESSGSWVNLVDATPPTSPVVTDGDDRKEHTMPSLNLGTLSSYTKQSRTYNDDVDDDVPSPPPPPPTLMLAISDNGSETSPKLVVLSPRSLRRDADGFAATSIGRSNECSLQVPNSCDLVSREHLKVEFVDGQWHATDVSSMGTVFRSQTEPKRSYRLQPKRPQPIVDGMRFYLGSFKEGGAVVRATLVSPRSAKRNRGSRRSFDTKT